MGGGIGRTAINMGWGNLGANTANNIMQSINEGTFSQDMEKNGAKILTGAFGMGVGNLYGNYWGNIFLPSVYGTTTDQILEGK